MQVRAEDKLYESINYLICDEMISLFPKNNNIFAHAPKNSNRRLWLSIHSINCP